MSLKWQIVSPEAVHMQTWGSETVVYDARSGDTHLLGAEAARVLAAVRQAPADTASLVRLLLAHGRDHSIDGASTKVEALLAELAGISLISPTTP